MSNSLTFDPETFNFTKTATFETLPLEVIEKVLGYGSVQDRLSMRLMNKNLLVCVDYLFNFSANFKESNIGNFLESKTRSGKQNINFRKTPMAFTCLNIHTRVNFHPSPTGLNVFNFDLTFIRELRIFCYLEGKTLEILLSHCPLISLLVLNGLAIAGGKEKLGLKQPGKPANRDPNRDLKVSCKLEFYPSSLKMFYPMHYMENLHQILSFPFIKENLTAFEFTNIVTSDEELFYLSPDAIICLLYGSSTSLKKLTIKGNGFLPGMRRHKDFPHINSMFFQIGCCCLPFAEWAFTQAERSKSENAAVVFQN